MSAGPGERWRDLCAACVATIQTPAGGVRIEPPTGSMEATAYSSSVEQVTAALERGQRVTCVSYMALPLLAVVTVRGTRYCGEHLPADYSR